MLGHHHRAIVYQGIELCQIEFEGDILFLTLLGPMLAAHH